jgi:putative heme iron utilization protein
MLTLASADQAFEFHLQLTDISKIVLVEKETPAKTLRIVRFLNAVGESMSSLILTDASDEAKAWYHGLVETQGSEIQL